MTGPEPIFPNITKVKLARDIIFFLDWALEMRGVQLTSPGTPTDVCGIVAAYVDIDHARLAEEMLHLEQVMDQEKLIAPNSFPARFMFGPYQRPAFQRRLVCLDFHLRPLPELRARSANEV